MIRYFDTKGKPWLVWVGFALLGLSLALLPFALAQIGTTWVRITNYAILYVMLALGLNIVVGFAGLLDLGYIAFYAVGAYVYALLASPHFNLHLQWWMILPIGAAIACLFGSNYKDVYAFIVLILVLVFRPSGLLGERVGDRA